MVLEMISYRTKHGLRVKWPAPQRCSRVSFLLLPKDGTKPLITKHQHSRQMSSTSKPRPKIFRVCDIPHMSPAGVKSFLSNLIQSHLKPDETHIKFEISPIPSCYSSSRNTSSALIKTENGYPNFLMDLIIDPLDMLHIKTGPSDISGDSSPRIGITVDQHFHGFTQAYFTKDEEVTADIIAITGMDAHGYGSWMSKSGTSCMWLCDLLSRDLPNCRTMVYGYQSKLSSWNMNQLSEYGREFFTEIGKVRYTDEQQKRPLFFVAHSYGGIVLAHCLIRAFRSRDKSRESVYRSAYGILFFGTPHRGSVTDALLKMVPQPGNPRQLALRQTEPGSDVLRMQLDDFTDIIGDRKIASFYETELTPTPEKGVDGKWLRTGLPRLQVSEASSILQLPDDIEQKFPVNANHSDMVKFKGHSDQTYTTVLRLFKEFERDAPRIVASRYTTSFSKQTSKFIVPFRQDHNFIGRKEILEHLEEILKPVKYHRRAALVGLGGAGKSQIAVEFVWRLRRQSPETSVYWVHASTTARFNQSYREIAEALDLPDRDDPRVDVIRLVFDHLSNETNGSWMMVLDNADDSSVFSTVRGSSAENEAIRQLSKALPQVKHGSILITSRDRKTADGLVVDTSTIVDVNPMLEEDASSLLRIRSADLKSPHIDAIRLVRQLESIPLAVSQAAAFISQKSPRMTISRYLALFQQSAEIQASLLTGELDEFQREPSIPNAIFKSWTITFDQIRERYPDSSDLLAIMSYLDPQAIPESLFTSKLAKDSLEFERRVSPLVSFNLVSPAIGGTSFNMHRLVQVATKAWLKNHNEDEKWKQEAMDLIVTAFPDASDSEMSAQWARCEELSPHAESILKQLPTSLNVRQDLAHASLLYNTAFYANMRGDFNLVLEKSIAAREIRSGLFGWGDPQVHNTSNLISSLLSETGRGSMAIRSIKANLRRRKESLGPNHTESKISLEMMAKLSDLLRDQGKTEEARKEGSEAVKGLEKLVGPLDPSTLAAKRTCALISFAEGDIELARYHLEDVLTQRTVVLGPSHIDTLRSTLDLATLYSSNVRYREALPLLQTAAKNLRKLLGPDHKLTRGAMRELEEAMMKSQKLIYSLWNGRLVRLLRFVAIPFPPIHEIPGTLMIGFYYLFTILAFIYVYGLSNWGWGY